MAKSKCTPERQQAVLQALSVGATHRLACHYAGISHECLYNWLRLGERGRQPYADFSAAMKKAEGQAAIGWLAKIEASANAGEWQAAAWKLERRYPDEYGRQLMQINWQLLTDEQVDRIAEGDAPQKVLGPHANGHPNSR